MSSVNVSLRPESTQMDQHHRTSTTGLRRDDEDANQSDFLLRKRTSLVHHKQRINYCHHCPSSSSSSSSSSSRIMVLVVVVVVVPPRVDPVAPRALPSTAAILVRSPPAIPIGPSRRQRNPAAPCFVPPARRCRSDGFGSSRSFHHHHRCRRRGWSRLGRSVRPRTAGKNPKTSFAVVVAEWPRL